MPLEAIRSAVAGEIWPLAADLAGTHALTLIAAGRGRALERTLASIDRTVLGGQPELAGALALGRVALGIRRRGGGADQRGPSRSRRRVCPPGRPRAGAA
jgi:hypothetical protein